MDQSQNPGPIEKLVIVDSVAGGDDSGGFIKYILHPKIFCFNEEVKQPEESCPDTGQPDEVSSSPSPTQEEVSSTEPSGTLPSQTPPKANPFHGVRPAKFVPGVNVLGGNPFAARPGLKSDVVSTAGPNQSVGPSNQAKFVLRPSALSSLPHNSAEQESGLQAGAMCPILKPAKLPDPFRSNSKEEVTEKENKEASPVKEKLKPPPDSGGGENGSSATSSVKELETLDCKVAEKEESKQPDSSSSPRSSSSNNNTDDKDNILGQNLTTKVTGVHTSPKGHVSSSGFVFGENLADRVVQRSISEENAEDGNASPDSTEQGNAEASKTLEESAREYQATHGKKTELQEVEIVTGEEDESNVLQVQGKLFVFDGDQQNWLERGRGMFRLNDMRCNSSATFQSRLLMRTQGSLRLILNTKVFPGMTVMRASQKSVRLTATDGDEGVKVFLLMTNPKDNENILRALDWRIQQLRVQEDKDVVQASEKRKAEPPESPTEEYIPKKAKKSPDEAFASFKREESDSSVIDPETEASSESHASSFTLRTDSD